MFLPASFVNAPWYGYPRSNGRDPSAAGQMTSLPEQRPSRAFGVARRAKVLTFEAGEDAIRGKEAVAALVSSDNACGVAFDFDDIRRWTCLFVRRP